ncbi:MaoC family dehydratase [Lentilactobacillus senioris]|uniref:MaoC family dehydratase n=1 Tax=Lentilactobacillus senioris TaxID=931534 RepID=UPI0022814AE7|nr:MaoC family dehydratase [Lentilactobacillus senioris]MCY9806362.1 MaoC family dehydratase [Lentilactobacillus senioris]
MDSYKIIYDDEIELGMMGTFSKRVTRQDVEDFAKVTGDFNPMHMDDGFANQTQFHERIAHGMISAGMISACIGTQMPGPGAIYLGQTLRFNKPVHFDDVLVVNVEITKIDQKKHFKLVTLKTTVTNQDGEVVTDGEAQIMPAQRDKK